MRALFTAYSPQQIAQAVEAVKRRRELVERREEVKARAEVSLVSFIREGWHVLEPETPFVPGYHLDAISDNLMACSRGEMLRLVINVPPGHMKSLECSVFWPAFEWGPLDTPGLRILSTSYNDDYVKRDTRKMRDLVLSEWFRTLWPEVVLTRAGEVSFENSRRGNREGVPFIRMTGGRGDRVLIDDPLSSEQAESATEINRVLRIVRESLPTRVNDVKRSVMVMVMQRLNEADPTGEVLAKELGWEHLMLPEKFEPRRMPYTPAKPSAHPDLAAKTTPVRWWPRENVYVPVGREVEFALYGRTPETLTQDDAAVVARLEHDIGARPVRHLFAQDWRTAEEELLWPQRFDAVEVARQNRAMTSYAVAGQKQQRPVPREGGMFKRESFRYLDRAPAGTLWVRRWDLAGTEDGQGARTAGVLMGLTPDDTVIVQHSVVERLEGMGVRKLIKATAESDGVGVLIGLPQDPGQAGKTQARDFVRELHGYNVRIELESGSKVTRAEPYAAQVENSNVFLIRGAWNDEYVRELATFPGGTLADQVDASSGAYGMLLKLRASRPTKIGGALTTPGDPRLQTREIG